MAAGRLNLQLYQRSADLFLGVPFNIASYALLTHMLAAQAGLEPGVFVWTGGDVHLYENHVDQAREQLTRAPRPLPTLRLAERPSLFDYRLEDVAFEGYDPWPRGSRRRWRSKRLLPTGCGRSPCPSPTNEKGPTPLLCREG